MILTTATIKGGTGKTTTAAALAQAAAADGKKVLAIDLDAQASLTYILKGEETQWGSYGVLHGEMPANCIQTTDQGIDLMAGCSDLAIENTGKGSSKRLQEALEPIKGGYDLIVIDTPPTMGELTFNALQASTGLIIPLEADRNSLPGLYRIIDIAKMTQGSNPQLKILGTVITRYDKRPQLRRFMRDVIAKQGEEAGAPLLMEIRQGVALQEAQAMQLSLYEYAPKSNPAQDYRALYEIVSKG